MSEFVQAEGVLAEVRSGVGIVTLNRPGALNALTLGMVRTMARTLDRWAEDDAVSAVVVRGSGERAFCAGGDIRAICESFKSGNEEYLDFFAEEYRLDHRIHRYPKPTLAVMSGFVMGGGMGLAQGCTVRVVTESSKLAMPEVGIGYFPDVGASYFLSRLPGALGLYLGLTGIQVRAGDAIPCGLADLYVSSVNVEDLVDAIARSPAGSIQRLRDVLGAFAATPRESALERLRPAIDLHFSQASIPAILESLRAERRPDFRDWAEETVSVMAARSPLAMSVTHEQLRRGASMSLEECLEMEFRMDQDWLPRGDMLEGVRAQIVDKDKQPKWNPPTLAEVTRASVQSFFDVNPGLRRLGL